MDTTMNANVRLQPRVQVHHPKLAMVSMMLGAFVGMFSETSLNIALPQLMAELHVSQASIQWLVTGYMLVIGIILPLSSILTKWFSTRQIVIFGLAAFTLGAIISAMGNVFGMVLLGRMIQGIGTGLILPLMFTVVMQIFPPQNIGAVMGMCALVIMFAPAIGPTLTGLILNVASWHWIFWSFVPFLLIALLFAITSLENVNELTKPHVDFISIIESIVSFSALIGGVSLASRDGWVATSVIGCLAIGLIALIMYCHRQLHLENPILNLRIFKYRDFRTGAIIVMVDFAIILSAMYLLPQYIQNGLLLPVALTGIIMLPGGVINALVSAFAGRLYDNTGAKLPVRLGMLIALVGVILLLFASDHSTVGYVIFAHIVLMIGCPLAMSPAQTSALNALNGRESSDGSTILNTMQQIIGALATALATSFLEIGRVAANGTSHAYAFTNGVHFGLYFTLVLVVIGLLTSFQIKDSNR